VKASTVPRHRKRQLSSVLLGFSIVFSIILMSAVDRARGQVRRVVFEGARSEHKWALKGLSPELPSWKPRKPYLGYFRSYAETDTTFLGLPDVYSEQFAREVDAAAARQCAPRKDDPYLVGYFVGNEPPWPGRESELVDMILAGPVISTTENYNIGILDVTDRPYPEMVKALIAVHKRLLAVHSGKATPFNRRPRASEAGTPSYRLSDAF